MGGRIYYETPELWKLSPPRAVKLRLRLEKGLRRGQHHVDALRLRRLSEELLDGADVVLRASGRADVSG
jgi:hypothetical protein